MAVARMARSSFYYQLDRMKRADKHAMLKTQILAVFAKHRGRYSYRKQWDGRPHPLTASMCQSGSVTDHSNKKGRPL